LDEAYAQGDVPWEVWRKNNINGQL
jgi:hypothetical protein